MRSLEETITGFVRARNAVNSAIAFRRRRALVRCCGPGLPSRELWMRRLGIGAGRCRGVWWLRAPAFVFFWDSLFSNEPSAPKVRVPTCEYARRNAPDYLSGSVPES